MKPTDISAPDYFHKVVDCQWACPAHTPVPHYIRLIAEGCWDEAYMADWEANVFPGILGRTCEPACRRGRADRESVAICRLKRSAADHKGDIRPLLDGFGLGMLFRDHRAAAPALSIREPPLQKSKGHSSSVGERVLDRRQCLIGPNAP